LFNKGESVPIVLDKLGNILVEIGLIFPRICIAIALPLDKINEFFVGNAVVKDTVNGKHVLTDIPWTGFRGLNCAIGTIH